MKKIFKRIISFIFVILFSCGTLTACSLSDVEDFINQTPQYTVTVENNIEGAGTVTGAGVYYENRTATLVATAGEGYRFVSWKKANGHLASEEAEYSFTVTRDVTLKATWIKTYNVTLTSEDTAAGTVTGGGVYDENSTTTIVATANRGYNFIGWYDGETQVSNVGSYTFKVTKDVSYAAKFEKKEVVEGELDELQIHFLEVGNKYTGDCTLIKVGDTEVLIDAGSRKGSAATLVPYIQQYCTDGVLEYVVATHAHQDHIAGFVGTAAADGIFESFVSGTIIDFAKTEATSAIYNDYVELRDAEVAAGAKHYTALECWNNENGAQRSYTLGEGITMNILYQKYYVEDASNENDYSVCLLFSQGDNHYLFTGDLEEHGEASLVESNSLPQVKLFKAGHHGSYTANSSELMAVIQPEVVCVCCCCGTDEYTDVVANQFPSQTFINNVAPYTDKIYVTSITDGADGFTSCNGNIVITSTGGELTVNCSNNNVIFKDTKWFKDNRIWPSNGVGGTSTTD